MNELVLLLVMNAMYQMNEWPQEKIHNFTECITSLIDQAIVDETEINLIREAFDVKLIPPHHDQG